MTDDCRIDIADNDARRGYELVTMNMYREMDGFLVLMSVHNTQNDHTAAIATPLLVFVVLGEATTDHPENYHLFRVCTYLNVPMQLTHQRVHRAD